jgi:hypothetical protein
MGRLLARVQEATAIQAHEVERPWHLTRRSIRVSGPRLGGRPDHLTASGVSR